MKYSRILRLQALEERATPAIFTVMNTNDGGPDSLRDCISKANLTPLMDQIDFAPALFSTPQTINLTSGEIAITQPLFINGPTSSPPTVSGSGASRIFNTTLAGPGASVQIQGLRMTAGVATDGGAIIAQDESLSLILCQIDSSQSTFQGGGLEMTGAGIVQMQFCYVRGNNAGTDGAGIYLGTGGQMFLDATEVSGNTAADDGGGAYFFNNGSFSIRNCTITGNKCSGDDGGGLYFFGNVLGSALISNSTFSGNSAFDAGGGVALINFNGNMVVENSTFTLNSSGGLGGAIARTSGGGVITLKSSIISKDLGPAVAPEIFTTGNCSYETTSLFNPAGITTLINLGGNRPFGEDPLLGPLALNGVGTVRTHALLAGSPCINAGSNPSGLPFDERGFGYPRVTNGTADIGAFETTQIYTVTNTNDAGPGSLRQAVLDANAFASVGEIIQFSPVFDFAQRITLTTGEIPINGPVDIQGKGSRLTTVSGNNASRIFNTTGAAVLDKISIEGLTLTAGNTGSRGGAIIEGQQKLSLTSCSFNGNGAFDGGAIDVETNGQLTLDTCTISGNTASDDGGGVYFFDSGLLEIRNCTVSGNTANGDDGGGLYFFGTSLGNILISNSTFSGNVASDSGGGIALLNFSGQLRVENSTVTNNRAGGVGGGISQTSPVGLINLESSAVSLNVAVSGDKDIFSPAPVSVKSCSIYDSAGFPLVDLGGNRPFNEDPMFGPLQFNGGPTLTHALLPGSPLIDVGTNPSALTLDQRGPTYSRVVNGSADIGAYETPKIFLVTNTADSGAGSLRQAILDANANVGQADVIRFSNLFNTPQVIGLTTGQLVVSDPVEIQGTGANLITVSGAGATRILDASTTPGTADIILNGLTLTQGNVPISGGAITTTDETLYLRGCVVANNIAGTDGGAIFTVAGSVTLDTCTVSGNIAGDDGGGAYFFNTGSLTVLNSTISGNMANGDDGGGLYFYGDPTGPLVIRNSTFSGNIAMDGGGAIALLNFGKLSNVPLSLQNSTITRNTANGVAGGSGGGVFRQLGFGSVRLQSTVVAQNNNPIAPDLSFDAGTNVRCDNSVIGVADKLNVVLVGAGNQTGILAAPLDAQLRALGNYGGPTQTHFPKPGSPVLDKGANPNGLTTDQRGMPRVFGIADVGAVEVNPQTFVVDLAIDQDNGNYNPGDLSLREAIDLANTSPTTVDNVVFDPIVFSGTKTIGLTLGEMVISGPVNINGPSNKVIVSGNLLSRVFDTIPSAPGTPINITSIDMVGGNPGGAGGAIFGDNESITLNNCNLIGNNATFGGAVFLVGGGTLTANDCTFMNNNATINMGAIGVIGGAGTKTILRRTTVSGNFGQAGGGVYAQNYLLVEDSTISNNKATVNNGGGIMVTGPFAVGALTVRNSTISGNTAMTDGGGISLFNVNGTLVVQNSTIVFNKAVNIGGGIAANTNIPVISLESDIVAKNQATFAQDIFGPGNVLQKTTSLFDPGGIVALINLGGNRPFLEDPMLLPLANNGGPTATHRLSSLSPVINQGSNPALLANDQRGPGFVRVIGSSADMGAFEWQAPPPAVVGNTVTINGGAVQRSRVTSILVDFTQLVSLPAVPETAFQLKRQSDNALVGLVATVVNTTATHVTLTFTPPTTDFGSLQDGRYTLTVYASKVSNFNGSLDGNGDGNDGDDFVLVGNPATAPKLFRLFGDADGNGIVDGVDFGAFRTAFNTSNNTFDFDNSGVVDGTDFGQFRARFGMVI